MNSEAINRYMAAKGYIETAKLAVLNPLWNVPERQVMSLMPLSMLAGFGVELMFKAWLLDCGKTPKEVRGYGHDIAKLYDDVKAEGFPADDNFDKLVDAFKTGHKDFTYRYIDDGDEISNINWDVAFPVLSRMNIIVDTKIGASASIGLVPGH